MNAPLKIAFLSALVSSFCSTTSLAQQKCPTIGKHELETLCNWKIVEKLRLGKAGKVTLADGTTLMNETGSCGGLDSIRSMITLDNTKFYDGTISKHPSDPSSKVLRLCTYKIHTFNKDAVIGFGVLFSKPIVEPAKENVPPPTKPRTFGGVDITQGPEERQVAVQQRQEKKPTEPLPHVTAPQRPPQGHNPLPPHLRPSIDELKANPPSEEPPSRPAPRKPVPPVPGDTTQSTASLPPRRSPPPVPARRLPEAPQAIEAPEHQDPSTEVTHDLRSELEKRLAAQRGQTGNQ